MMFDTALKIQTSDFSTIVGAAPVITQIEQLLLYFEEHAYHEDMHVLPCVGKFKPQLIEDFESQHDEDHRLAYELKQSLAGWKIAEGSVARIAAGRKIFYKFNEFVAFNLYHMNKEEHFLNAVLWRHYSEPEIKEITQRIIQGIKPQILLEESRWMMRSINTREAIDWLMGIKVSAPSEMFRLYLKIAHEEMPFERWIKVKDSLFDETLISENLN